MTTNKATSPAGTSAGPTVPDAASSGDPQLIRADIEQTRAELGDSVEALAAKADVKARARRGVEAAKVRASETAEAAAERVKDTAGQVGETVRRRPAPVAAALAAVGAVIGSVVFLRRRRAAKARAGLRRWRSR